MAKLLKISALKLAYVENFYYLYYRKRPYLHHLLNLDIMFLPYDIVILLILSPFLLLLWIAGRIIRFAVKLAVRLVKYALKLTFRLLVVLFGRIRRLL